MTLPTRLCLNSNVKMTKLIHWQTLNHVLNTLEHKQKGNSLSYYNQAIRHIISNLSYTYKYSKTPCHLTLYKQGLDGYTLNEIFKTIQELETEFFYNALRGECSTHYSVEIGVILKELQKELFLS